MSRIYDRTEYDDLFPALDSLHPTVPIANKQPYEQIFTAPGTWTCPPTVTWVEVTAVGGGGGGTGAYPGQTGGGAGGGGVRRDFVPVSGPVPVTIGAGGTVGTPAPPFSGSTAGSAGGTTSFGPFSVGGGGGAAGGGASGPTAAPPDGGGGGSRPGGGLRSDAGLYGSQSYSETGGGARDAGNIANAPFGNTTFGGSVSSSKGKYGFGGGGNRYNLVIGPSPYPGVGAKDGGGEPGTAAVANRGGGGGGTPYGTGGSGGAGGSGILIVRWWA